jgi:enterochelin esterase family protein
LKIYLPPGYDSLSSENYPSVYFQDGFEYVSLGSAVNVIDNLIDSNLIVPVIAVFVKPNDRNVEYAGSKRNQYRLFFVNELVPYIDSNFKTAAIPANRLVLGDSYGGNISALISYNHPEVFALCGLHSGAFQPNGYEIYNKVMTDLANGIVKDINWSSIWGTYEGSLTGTMSSFRDSLIAHGYSVDWEERHEGHSWGLWRATIDKMLTYFFPDSATSVEDEEFAFPNEFILEQNYPNPFNPGTKIIYSIPQNSFVSLKVYDVLGNELANLVDAQQSAGRYEVIFDGSNLASGIYLYTLKAGNFTSTKKLVLMK